VNELLPVAKKLFWWQTPQESLRDENRFLAQVMTYGTLEDLFTVRKHYSLTDFRKVLLNPPLGVFDKKSWKYWHLVCNLNPKTPLATRQYE